MYFFVLDIDEPRGSCRFPEVLVNRNKWRDLSGKWLLEVEPGVRVLRLKDRQSNHGFTYTTGTMGFDTSATKLVLRCVKNTDQAQTISGDVLQTDYQTYVTDDNWYVSAAKMCKHTIYFTTRPLFH